MSIFSTEDKKWGTCKDLQGSISFSHPLHYLLLPFSESPIASPLSSFFSPSHPPANQPLSSAFPLSSCSLGKVWQGCVVPDMVPAPVAWSVYARPSLPLENPQGRLSSLSSPHHFLFQPSWQPHILILSSFLSPKTQTLFSYIIDLYPTFISFISQLFL